MKIRTLTTAIAVTLFAQTAIAHDFKVGDLVIDHPVAFATFSSAMSGAGYLSVTNNGAQDDRLIGIEAGFPRVMLHTTEMDGDIATMPHVEGIAVPAGETIRLVPGGFHIMFMGLNGNPLIEGETFDATLEFENAGTVDVVFNVEARDSDIEGTDHSQH